MPKPNIKDTSATVTQADFQKLTDTLDRWRVQVQAKQEKHEHTLYGNGTPGMDEQIRNITSYIELLVKLAWIIVGGVVTIALSGTAYAVVYIIRNAK